jgi:hypothetical protein
MTPYSESTQIRFLHSDARALEAFSAFFTRDFSPLLLLSLLDTTPRGDVQSTVFPPAVLVYCIFLFIYLYHVQTFCLFSSQLLYESPTLAWRTVNCPA